MTTLNLYNNPPQEIVSLDKLEQICYKWLLLLKKVEFLNDSGETENMNKLVQKFGIEQELMNT